MSGSGVVSEAGTDVSVGDFFWLTGILLGDVLGDVCPVLRSKVCAGTVAILPGAELYLSKGRRLGEVAWLPILTLFCRSSEDCLGRLLLAYSSTSPGLTRDLGFRVVIG